MRTYLVFLVFCIHLGRSRLPSGIISFQAEEFPSTFFVFQFYWQLSLSSFVYKKMFFFSFNLGMILSFDIKFMLTIMSHFKDTLLVFFSLFWWWEISCHSCHWPQQFIDLMHVFFSVFMTFIYFCFLVVWWLNIDLSVFILDGVNWASCISALLFLIKFGKLLVNVF